MKLLLILIIIGGIYKHIERRDDEASQQTPSPSIERDVVEELELVYTDFDEYSDEDLDDDGRYRTHDYNEDDIDEEDMYLWDDDEPVDIYAEDEEDDDF